MADIKQITLGGTTYNLKDEAARTSIASLQQSVSGGMHYIGETSTALTDQSTTSTLVAKSAGSLSKTSGFAAGDIVIYDKKEFVWNGSLWSEFGSTGSLKALAFKDTAKGNVTIPSVNHTHTVEVGSHSHTVTQGSVSVSGNVTPSGRIDFSWRKVSPTDESEYMKFGDGDILLTEQEFDTESVVKSINTEKVYEITGVGSLPTFAATSIPNVTNVGTLPTYAAKSIPNVTNAGTMFKAEVNGEVLTLTPGTAPTLGTAISVNSITGVGTLPTLGTAISVNSITNAGTLPTRAQKDVVTSGITTEVAKLNISSDSIYELVSQYVDVSFTGTPQSVTLTGSTSGVAVSSANIGTKTSGAPSATASPEVTVS